MYNPYLQNASPAARSEPDDAGDGKAAVDHPIDILLAEHERLLKLVDALVTAAQGLTADPDEAVVARIAEQLRESESHYVREENVLFPYLEKHGVKQPPAVMWMEHDQIRPVKKEVRALIAAYAESPSAEAARRIASRAEHLRSLLESHFYKENNILFPTALQVVEAGEWAEILAEFDELGYPSFSADLRPERVAPIARASSSNSALSSDGEIGLETGALSLAELEGITSVLPVELTFVDAEDRVRWFSNQKERIFVRTKSAIGREVAQCHPQKSLHLVEQILAEFRAASRDQAEFWLSVNERMLHIRFFAVRDLDRKYLGCLEVTQDVTEIRKLTGQKRLV